MLCLPASGTVGSKLKNYPYIHRRGQGKLSSGWVVHLGTIYYKYFHDADYGGPEMALQAAFADRDEYLPAYLDGTLSSNREEASEKRMRPKRPKGLSESSSQLRIRMGTTECELLEKQLQADRQGGAFYAKTLSSWVRHHLHIVFLPDSIGPYYIAQGLQERLKSLAQRLNKEPECMAEESVKAMLEIIENPEAVPSMIAEYRLRVIAD